MRSTTPPGLPQSSLVTRMSSGSSAAICTVRSIAASLGPSPAQRPARHQVRLNLVPDARISFNFEPAGYRLHLWQDGGLVTHTAVFGEWIDPEPSRLGL